MAEIDQELGLNPKNSITPIDLPDCYTKIAELAFYKAEARGFEPGHELDDWIEAELEFKAIVVKGTIHKPRII